MWRQRDEQRPSRPPHPPPWHLNLQLRSAAGTRLSSAAGKRSLPTIHYFSLRSGFKIGSENPNSGATSPPVQLSGFCGLFVPEPSPRQAAKARGRSAASRRAPRGAAGSGHARSPRGAGFSPAAGAGRSRPGRRLEPGERQGAKLRGHERRAEAGRAGGERAPSACGRGAAGAPRGGALLATWTPLTWGARALRGQASPECNHRL